MLCDLVLPGRRIDVPVELVSTSRHSAPKKSPERREHAAVVAV
jgi:hypothetical protein